MTFIFILYVQSKLTCYLSILMHLRNKHTCAHTHTHTHTHMHTHTHSLTHRKQIGTDFGIQPDSEYRCYYTHETMLGYTYKMIH